MSDQNPKLIRLPFATREARYRNEAAAWNRRDHREACILCGKPTNGDSEVHMTTSLNALPVDYEDPEGRELGEYPGCPIFEDGSNSQGWFNIGSSCRKKLPKTHWRKR